MSQLGETLYTTIWIFIYLLILTGFFTVLGAVVVSKLRKKKEEARQYNLTFLQVKLPPQNETEIQVAEQMFAGLMGIRKYGWDALFSGQYRISFEIVSKSEGIGFYVVVPDELVTLVEKQINGAYPDAEIDIVDPNEIWDRGHFTSVMELKLANQPFFPILTFEDLGADAMSAITSAMSKMNSDEVLALQYVVRPAGNWWRTDGHRYLGGVRARQQDPERKGPPVDSEELAGVEKKLANPGFDVAVRIISIAQDKIAADAHIRNVASAFEQFNNVRGNNFKRKSSFLSSRIANDFIHRRLHAFSLKIPVLEITLFSSSSVLNTEEMATVFHFPNKDIKTPNIIWLHSRRSSAPTHIPDEGLYLGKSIFRGVTKEIHMLRKDRTRHTYIIGQTGTGKSQLMMSLAVQDIKNGEGLAFIDPHGSDIDDLLQKIPPERMDDVILFNVSDTQRPLGLNILEAENEDQKNMIINAFIALLYKLYDPNRQGIMGPKLERAIRNVMLTAMVDKDSTLVDVLRLLIDQKYVEKFLPMLDDPLVKRYWTDEIAKTSDFHKSETMGYFVSKFDRFVTERAMRNILGQPKSAINFNEVMSQKKILLIDLSKGKIGEENSNFLGLILVPKILASAMNRAYQLAQGVDFPDFYLYVDEFQNFATPDFATILSEARKYKLNLIVANQFIAQLQDEIKEAVFGNVGTLVSFRCGADDSEYLEKQFEPIFTSNDLINLPIGNCYMRLLVDGQPTPPFSMAVDWDSITSTKKDPAVAEEIRKRTRERYGRPVEEVEAYISERAGFNEPPPPEPAAERPPPPKFVPPKRNPFVKAD